MFTFDTLFERLRKFYTLYFINLLITEGYFMMECEEEDCSLFNGFRLPPKSAGVKTWWHWMNGNITDVGISLDLEAMNRAGIIGFQMFQVGAGIPKGPVNYGSDEHLRLLLHAVKESERLGLEFVMHNCPGWSSSGGPWITPERSMKMLVWSETYIAGGGHVEIVLPKPYANHDYYRDIYVLAFPSLRGEKQPFKNLVSKVVSSSGPVNIDLITDNNPETGVEIRPLDPNKPAYLQLEFAEPFEARSIAVTFAPFGIRPFWTPLVVSLEASDDGVNFRKICDISTTIPFGRRISIPSTANFPALRAKYFRLISSEPFRILEVRLFWAARIADWPIKANFTGGAVPPFKETVEDPSGSAIDPNSVIDVTKYMNEEGRLVWDAPPGDWNVYP
ncbi:glycosyl hydrolase family 43, partial [Candidatus Bathyarchaeota archaeon]|nr:glycosyl hydrolase family 43 [Candidatus Bathyarchaeota archaeon]